MFCSDIKVDKDKVFELAELNPIKARNIYVYGSRVYGTNRPDSDTDILITACTMDARQEFNNGKYNVHIVTPDIFEDRLRRHEMQQLECIFAPSKAIIQEKVDYRSSFELGRNRLKKMSLSQSAHSWYQAKMRIKDGDIERGAKSLFHSLRILVFAEQILNEGCIFDFSEANMWHEEIMEDDSYEWTDYKIKWLKKKLFMERLVKKA
ncbi:nucleotidyltransferase domain-containing protein [bacterium]|nr:MAG: nucleotidyltransferase domain-containing protein [bacterium]